MMVAMAFQGQPVSQRSEVAAFRSLEEACSEGLKNCERGAEDARRDGGAHAVMVATVLDAQASIYKVCPTFQDSHPSFPALRSPLPTPRSQHHSPLAALRSLIPSPPPFRLGCNKRQRGPRRRPAACKAAASWV